MSLVKALFDDLETSQVATGKVEKKDERQKGLVLVAEKSKNNALNDVASFRGWVALAGTHEDVLLSNAFVA